MSADILNFDARPENIQAARIGTAPAAAPPTSPTVLDVDQWGTRRAADIASRWAELPGDEKAAALHEASNQRPLIADAHAALFDIEPKAAARPADATRAAWFRQLMETPEYKALHSQTCLDADLAELGAAVLCRQWLEYQADEEGKPAPKPDANGNTPEPGSDAEPIADQVARIRSTADALKAAAEEVQAGQDVRAGLGTGDEAAGAALDPATFRAHFDRIKNDPTLRAIMQLAGRMRALASALQRAKVRHGADEICGVEPTGDPARLVPAELAQLACGIDEVELLAAFRLVQRQSLGRAMRATEKQGRGPIIVSVDESGSMNGPRIQAAKALACALAWLAHHQGRWIMLSGFWAGADHHYYCAEPRHSNPAALMDWLQHFYNGGSTDLNAPLGSLPAMLDRMTPPPGRVDHIVITDAECDLPAALRDSYRAWSKAHDVYTYGIVIGTNDAGQLPEVCTRAWCVPSLDLDSLAVAEVLSL